MDLKSLWEAAKIIEAESPIFQPRAPHYRVGRCNSAPHKDQSAELFNRSSYSPSNKKSTANRLNHNNLEKCRRAYLRDCLGNLRSFIPKSSDCNKATTLSLLVTSKDYISTLQDVENDLKDSIQDAYVRFSQLRNLISTRLNISLPERPEQLRTIQFCNSDICTTRTDRNIDEESSSTESTMSMKSEDSTDSSFFSNHTSHQRSGSFVHSSDSSTQDVLCQKQSGFAMNHTKNEFHDFDSRLSDEEKPDSSSEISDRNDSPMPEYDGDHLYNIDSLGRETVKSNGEPNAYRNYKSKDNIDGYGGTSCTSPSSPSSDVPDDAKLQTQRIGCLLELEDCDISPPSLYQAPDGDTSPRSSCTVRDLRFPTPKEEPIPVTYGLKKNEPSFEKVRSRKSSVCSVTEQYYPRLYDKKLMFDSGVSNPNRRRGWVVSPYVL